MNQCDNNPAPRPYCVPYAGFTEFVASIPKLYFGVKSQEQRILAICEQLDKLICFTDYQGTKINLNRADIDWLIDQFEKFKESGFDDYYLEQVEKWIKNNLEYIYRYTIKQIYFGLDNGHLVAWIPESWEDIQFDTIMNFSDPNYGSLVIIY